MYVYDSLLKLIRKIVQTITIFTVVSNLYIREIVEDFKGDDIVASTYGFGTMVSLYG